MLRPFLRGPCKERYGLLMGAILCSRRSDNEHVIVEVLLHQEEYRQLRGELNNVCMFSENVAHVPSKVSLRGRNEVTKYFLIPRQLRKQLLITGSVSCQRLDVAGKAVFVYVLDAYSGTHRISEH